MRWFRKPMGAIPNRFDSCTLRLKNNMDFEKQLIKDVRAVIDSDEIFEVRKGSNTWRIVANFRSDYPERDRLIKFYYVWLSGDYLSFCKVKPAKKALAQVTLKVIQERFKQSDNTVPIEDGISALDSNNRIIVDPKSYIHPEEKM